MYKIGLHAGYWGASELDGKLNDLIELYPKLGLDIIEISEAMIDHYSDDEIKDFRMRLADNGLDVVFNGGINANLDMASANAEVRAAGVESCKRILDKVAKAGGKIFSGVNYSVWKRLPAAPITAEEKQTIVEYSADSMRKLMPTAENLGILYAFEIVNRFEQFLINTVDEGLAFCEMVGSDAATLQLDTFHMNIDERNMFEAMKKAQRAGKFAHLHVGEPDRSIPGLAESHLDWKKVFGSLNECGYAGAVSIEPFVRMETMRHFSGCVWRQLSENDMESRCSDVKKSVSFLKSL